MPLAARTRTVAALLLVAMFAALNVQLVSATGRVVDDAGGDGAVKLYHLALGMGVLLVVARGWTVRWTDDALLYAFVVTITATLLAVVGVPQVRLVNAGAAFAAAVVMATLARAAGRDLTLRALRLVAWGMLAAVIVKAVLYRDAILLFLLVPNGHPILPSFYGGGPNLEATWLALATAFFIGSRGRSFWTYALGALAVSTLYASRVGVLGVALMVLLRVLTPERRRERLVLFGLVLPAVAVAAATLVEQTAGLGYVASRFAAMGDDPGSMGRLALWTGAMRLFTAHPFGVGLGNAVPGIIAMTGRAFTEDNLHNLYLQHLVELGVPGLASFLLFALWTVRRLRAQRWRDPFLAYLAGYFALATLQFRGFEALAWAMYGAWLGVRAADAAEELPVDVHVGLDVHGPGHRYAGRDVHRLAGDAGDLR